MVENAPRFPLWWLLGLAAAGGLATAGGVALESFLGRSKPTPFTSRWSGEPGEPKDQSSYQRIMDIARQKTGVDWGLPQVSVYSFPKPAQNLSEPPTLKDLSARGQSAYIEALAKGVDKSDVVRNELGKPITEASQQDVRQGHDPYRFDRVLVASVMKGADMLPGDRLVWTRTMIQPVNFQFAGYTVATTKNSTVKIADVEQDLSHNLSGKLGATIPIAGSPKLEVKAGSESADKTTGELTSQFEDVGIDITPDFLRIYRESERNSDVSGNTQVELSMITDPSRIHLAPEDQRTPIVRLTKLMTSCWWRRALI
jgi:hypothetical protein